jgi:putative spermidine/putrescine transport system substrate-binding protein
LVKANKIKSIYFKGVEMIDLKRISALVVVGSIALSGCGSSTSNTASSQSPSATNCGTTVDEIAASAKKEGDLNLIALPDTWANYKGVLSTFKDKYGINAVVANPDASSADELTAIKTLRGQATMPEIVDIGPSFTQEFVSNGWAQSYKTTNWDEIPDVLKDADGNWFGAYSGTMVIGANSKLVKNAPKSWADLKNPEYKNQVTINGDPREAGAAFAAVMAASIANGGSYDDIMPGIQFFSDLKAAGNLNLMDITPASILSGDAPIAIDWSYNFPGIAPELAKAGFDMNVNTPSDALYVGYYALGAVSEAPHPCSAQLFLEHLASDDGALEYIKGGAIPARLGAMLDAGVIPADLAKNLPTKEQFAAVKIPTADQVTKAKADLTANWGPMVADK